MLIIVFVVDTLQSHLLQPAAAGIDHDEQFLSARDHVSGAHDGEQLPAAENQPKLNVSPSAAPFPGLSVHTELPSNTQAERELLAADEEPSSVVPTFVAPRPGFRACNGSPPRDRIAFQDRIRASAHDLRLSVDYTMIVMIDSKWCEIWCHICGCNANLKVPGGSVAHLLGAAGLSLHLSSKHSSLNGKGWTQAAAIAACGKHFLSDEEFEGLCEWKLTTNKVISPAKSNISGVTKWFAALPPPLPTRSSDVPSSHTWRPSPALGKRRISELEEHEDDNIIVAGESVRNTKPSRMSSEKIRFDDGSEFEI